MRDIKFRAWDKDTEQMLTMPLCSHFGLGRFFGFIPENAVLMQYTGLKDKNGKGKEAYIGDIAKDEHGQVFVIEWDYPLLARLQEIWFEVIGNIHENPELLTNNQK